MSTTVDKQTFRVNLGILGTLITLSVSGAFWASNMSSNVISATDKIVEVRKSIDRVEQQLAIDGKALAVLETLVGTLDRRIASLEKAAK